MPSMLSRIIAVSILLLWMKAFSASGRGVDSQYLARRKGLNDSIYIGKPLSKTIPIYVVDNHIFYPTHSNSLVGG